MKHVYYRVYQTVFRLVSYLLPWKQPLIINDENPVETLVAHIKKLGFTRIFFVCDPGIVKLNLHASLLSTLTGSEFNVTLFDRLQPNPTIASIEEGATMYQLHQCELILAMGGGSAIDCAKGIGIKVVKPSTPFAKMKGVLKVLKKIPYLIAIPTTSGTGSEATIATVITDEKTHEKYAISDPVLMPKVAVLDARLTLSLPPMLTATTAIDALTHAVEAYLGRSNTAQTKKQALQAVELIFTHLPIVMEHPTSEESRGALQLAAYQAGCAFTRAYVGYIHAIAHTLGGQYSTPHGLANAIVMPHVLRWYGSSMVQKGAQLARAAHIGNPSDSDEILCEAFIRAIEHLNETSNIPKGFKELQKEDIPKLAKRAYQEAHPLYPVIKIMDLHQIESMYHQLLS